MGDHMQMARDMPARPGDAGKAEEIVKAARGGLARYPDSASAERDGYKPFHETGKLGEEVHFTNMRTAMAEARHIDYEYPGSILFTRTNQGLRSVGVMYTAPGKSNAAELDDRAPLSKASWHRHVDFCFSSSGSQTDKAAGLGFTGIIHDEAACTKAGGYWLPLLFGWMTHICPGRADPWNGEKMHAGSAVMTHQM